jgi:acetolactate synthase-1/2/3 large subunit
VLALIGDGAAQFTFMELAAAVQERLPILVLLWNNRGYREIHAGMHAAKYRLGVDIDAPDFMAAARALGCEAERVS